MYFYKGKKKSLNIFFHILYAENIKDLTILFNYNPARLRDNNIKASSLKKTW